MGSANTSTGVTNTTEFDVIIVGGGIVGASLACLLEHTPLRVALVDRNLFDGSAIPYLQEQPKFDPRVSAITSASKKLFQEIGIWRTIEQQRCCRYQEMHVWDADGTGSIHFSAADLNQAELGCIIENSIVSSALYNRLTQLQNLQILAPFTIERFTNQESENSIHLETEEGKVFTTRLLIAADGANSKIRKLANFKTREWDYNHQALVTTVKTELLTTTPPCNDLWKPDPWHSCHLHQALIPATSITVR